jgi:hypothetical protein
VPPGIVPASRWRPGRDNTGSEDSAEEDATACGVGFRQ